MLVESYKRRGFYGNSNRRGLLLMLYLVIPFISDSLSSHRDKNLCNLLEGLKNTNTDFEVVILYWGSNIFDPHNFSKYDFKVHVEDLRDSFPFSMLNRYKHIPSFIEPDDVIQTLDCDMFVTEEYLSIIKRTIERRDVFFPICFSVYENKPPIVDDENGWWRISGWGMRALTRKNWDKIDFSDYITDTGRGEDMLFLERTKKANLSIIRFNCNGLFHMWHPDKFEYKNRLFNKIVK